MITKGEIDNMKIAIVHDELTRRGGAECVLEEMLTLLPHTDLYALYSGTPLLKISDRDVPIKTSFLQNTPKWFRQHPSRLLPLLPQAAEQFDLSKYDLVITSASGFAKSVVTRVNIPHICYCHTPTRYLWDTSHQTLKFTPFFNKIPTYLLFHFLRLSDFAAAQRVDIFIANSKFTQRRIATYYRRPSYLVYPPIHTEFFTPGHNYSKKLKHTSFFLCVGRLTKSKHFDQAVRVCQKLKLKLVIVGRGPEAKRLKSLGGQYLKLLHHLPSDQLRNLYRNCRALIQPGIEDFGMSSAECLSCGTPVIAFGQGGATEIIDSTTGILYKHFGDEFLAEAIRKFIKKESNFSQEFLQQSTLRFSVPNFQENFKSLITLAKNNTSLN